MKKKDRDEMKRNFIVKNTKLLREMNGRERESEWVLFNIYIYFKAKNFMLLNKKKKRRRYEKIYEIFSIVYSYCKTWKQKIKLALFSILN